MQDTPALLGGPMRRAVPWLVAGVLASALLSLLSLQRSAALQAAADSVPVIERLQADLSGPLQADNQPLLRQRVRELLATPDLALHWLQVRDAAGVVLIGAGRHENLRTPLLPDGLARALRDLLYRLEGHVGQAPVERGLGQLDYVIGSPPHGVAAPLAESWRRAGAAGLLLSLLLGLVLIPALYWRWPLPAKAAAGDPALSRRAPSVSAPEALPAGLLDQAGVALLTVSRDGAVRSINPLAERLCGWSAREACGRPVYSVFHCLDDAGTPGISAAERCLREGAAVPLQRGRLRTRRGGEHPVEMRAVPLKDGDGRVDGAAMLFTETAAQQREVSALRDAAQYSQSVIDALDEGLLTTDRAGVVRSANARALRMFGYERAELAGCTISKLLPVPFLHATEVRLTDYRAGAPASAPLPRVVAWRKDATTFPVQLQVQPIGVAGSELVLIVRDISDRLRGEGLARRLGRLLDATAEEIYVFEGQSLHIVEYSRGACRSLGVGAETLQGMTLPEIGVDVEAAQFGELLDELRSGAREQVVYQNRHRRSDGSLYPVEVRLSYSREEQPPVFMAIATDISDRVQAENQLRDQAQRDALTGLPNRRVLLARMGDFLRVATERGHQAAVLFVDLDHFKPINDARGHAAGDQVLRTAAQRLAAAVRGSDLVVRLGGDEFAVLAGDLHSVTDADRVADKLLRAFAEPADCDGQPQPISASIGVALFPQHGTDGDVLLRHADQAMYQAKQAGRGCYRIYSGQA
jgi:diguanylate cyclase (GGDEF)-like protein/PAS domain S-box-containing protein